MQLPSVYSYLDFRSYIHDYQKARVKFEKDFTMKHICRQLGLEKSRNYICLIINGRKLSKHYAVKIAKIFQLSEYEEQYFLTLVDYNQCENSPLKKTLSLQLEKLKIPNDLQVSAEVSTWLLSRWFRIVLLEFFEYFDIGDDISFLYDFFSPYVDLNEIKESFETFLKYKILEKNSDGFFKESRSNNPTKLHRFKSKDQSNVFKTHFLEWLHISLDIISKKKHKELFNFAVCLELSPHAFQSVREMIKELHSEIIKIVKEKHTDSTFYSVLISLDQLLN